MPSEKIIINPTLNPKLEPKKKTAPILRAYYRPFFFAAVPAWLLTVFFSFFFYHYLPPVIPLYGSLAAASERLADKQMVFLLPAIATTIIFIHALVIYFGRKYEVLLLEVFDYWTVFIQVLILAVLLRIILVII